MMNKRSEDGGRAKKDSKGRKEFKFGTRKREKSQTKKVRRVELSLG
jgi:hypothetical protein